MRTQALLLTFLAAAIGALWLHADPPGGRSGGAPPGEVADPRLYLMHYGSSSFPVGFATSAAEFRGRARMELGWMFYVLVTRDRVVLIDTGFTEARRRSVFGVKPFRSPRGLLAAIGVTPDRVTDVILSHGHFDHAGELTRFGKARLWLRAPTPAILRSRHGPGGVDGYLRAARNTGRLRQLPATAGPLTVVLALPGLRVDVRASGGHTAGSQLTRIRQGRRVFWITGDECYLVNDCREGRPLPGRAAFSPAANRAAVVFLQKEAEQGAVLLNQHDPGLAGSLPEVLPGVHRVF